MNKTVTINLAGLVFYIEEEAYEILKSYISNIKKHFQNEEGRDEIVADIESRLAELLKAKTHAGKQVLVNQDINDAISVMGQPEDMAETSSADSREESSGHSQQSHYNNKTRRVFRDPDSKVLGGVCSGIANYFDTDPLWIRLLLVVMFFGFGSGFLLYIILWIIIPEAKTTAEKLEMHGEPVDINTISKTIKDEAENIKNRAKEYGKEVKDQFSAGKKNAGKFGNLIYQVFHGIITVIGKIFGVFFVLFGILLFMALLCILIGIGTIDNLSVSEFINSFAGPDFPMFWFKTGLALALGIPFCMLVYKGMKLLLGIKYRNRWMNIGAGILWLVGLCISSYIGITFAKEFSQETVLKQQIDVSWPVNDTLFIKANSNYNRSENDVDLEMQHDRWLINTSNKPPVWRGRPSIKIITSENDSLYVLLIKKANGNEKSEASLRAKNISYKLSQLDSVLVLDKYFSFQSSDKFRNQEVEVLIKLPKGKTVYLDNNLKNLLYDIENTNGIIDYNMGGKYWKMTENGLTCLNCSAAELERGEFEKAGHFIDPNSRIKFDEHGIEIKSQDAHVKIDEDGIKIDSKEKRDDEE